MAPPTRITNNLAKFKNADVIGHPGVEVFNQFVVHLGLFLRGRGHGVHAVPAQHPGHAGLALQRARDGLPGGADSGQARGRARTTMNPGATCIRAAASRTVPTTTGRRRGGPARRRCRHAPWADPRLSAAARQLAAWLQPAGALMEGDASTGKWQELTPVLSSSCTVFPRSGFLTQAQQGRLRLGAVAALCVLRTSGPVFLGSVDFQ